MYRPSTSIWSRRVYLVECNRRDELDGKAYEAYHRYYVEINQIYGHFLVFQSFWKYIISSFLLLIYKIKIYYIALNTLNIMYGTYLSYNKSKIDILITLYCKIKMSNSLSLSLLLSGVDCFY